MAMSFAPSAIPPNPKIAAMMAIIKNVIIQRIIFIVFEVNMTQGKKEYLTNLFFLSTLTRINNNFKKSSVLLKMFQNYLWINIVFLSSLQTEREYLNFPHVSQVHPNK